VLSAERCRRIVGDRRAEREARILSVYVGVSTSKVAEWEGCSPRTVRGVRRRNGILYDGTPRARLVDQWACDAEFARIISRSELAEET
jgi:hypothetical protein